MRPRIGWKSEVREAKGVQLIGVSKYETKCI
jgi:hypothetical protein